jgi:hypothetical protein
MLQSLYISKGQNFLGEPNDSSDAFSVEMQRELAKLQEGLFNTSFDQKSWETLTLGNRQQTKQSISFANANMIREAISFTRNEEQEHRFME